MKTEKTKTAYTASKGGKNQAFSCEVCNKMVRSYGTAYKIRGQKIGLYCSPDCIDRAILGNKSA